MTEPHLDAALGDRLKRTFVLSVLDADQFHNLIAEGDLVQYKLSAIIGKAGEPCDAIYLLVSGKVRVTVPRGAQEVTLYTLARAGDILGSEVLSKDNRWIFTSRAAGDCVFLRVPAERTRELAQQAPAFAKRLEQDRELIRKYCLLRQCERFEGLNYWQARSVLLRSTSLRLDCKDQMTDTQPLSECLSVVLNGVVEVFDGTARHQLKAGAFFGQENLRSPRGASSATSVTCLQDAELLLLSRLAYEDLGNHNPDTFAELDFLLFSSQGDGKADEESRAIVSKDIHQAPAAAAKQEPLNREPVTASLRRSLRRYPFISQQSEMDCGATCLAMISLFYGRGVSLNYVRELADVSRYGTSLLALAEAADKLGFIAKGVRATYDGLRQLKLPVICHWRQNHFVVLYRITDAYAIIGDPAEDLVKVPRNRFSKLFSGVALELSPTVKFGSAFTGKHALTMLLPLLSPYKGLIQDILLASLVYQSLMIVIPLFTQVLIDKVIVHQNLSMLNIMLLGMVIITLFESFIFAIRSFLLAFFATKADQTLFSNFFRHLLSLPLKFFDNRSTGDILARFAENRKIRDFLAGAGITAILDSLVIATYMLVIFLYSMSFGIAVFIYMSLLFGIMAVYTPILKNFSRRVFDKEAASQGLIVESVRGIEGVKAAAMENMTRYRWEESFVEALNIRFKELLAQSGGQVISKLIHLGGTVALLYLGANLVVQERLTIGQLMALYMMVEAISLPVMRLIEMWDSLQNVNIALERVGDVLQADPEEADRASKIPLTKLRGHVRLDAVTFRYSELEDRNTLLNVSLEASPGEMIALVGRSGSGKSTLLKLIEGLYVPVHGHVRIDGHDITRVCLSDLRRQIGVVSQQEYYFRGTLREALSIYKPHATLDEIIEATKFAGIHDFIESLPYGYETRLNEGAVNLSGGQRQRLAIARAILHEPRILIFDEATSALDAETESLIQRNMTSLRPGRTIFVAAHRLSTVKDADVILVMERGQIVESGSHESLIAARGLYYYLCKEQLCL